MVRIKDRIVTLTIRSRLLRLRNLWCCVTLVLVVAGILLIGANTAWALRTNRTLTQAFLRKWQAPNGLPQAAVLAIFQSTEDRLWLGTQAGLFLFDGLRFQHCRVVEGIPLENVWIQDIQESSDGAIWIATYGQGLIRYQNEIARQVAPDSGLQHANIFKLLIDKPGNIWIATDVGLFYYDHTALTRIDPVSSALLEVRALCETPDGKIWVGGQGNQLYVQAESGFVPLQLKSVSNDVLVTELLSTPDGALWIGTHSGLISLKENKEELFTRKNGLADDAVECLEIESGGSLWVGTRDGISRKLGSEIESFRTRDGLSQSTACSLLVDREGSVWVGTKNGLNQFIDRRTLPITTTEGLGSNDAGPLLQDANGTIWLGTIGAGLGRFDGRACTMEYSSKNGLASDRLFSLAESKGKIWIGTDSGLCCLEQGEITHTLTVDDGLPANHIQALCVDENGNVWIGTKGGLAIWDGKNLSHADDKEPAFRKSIISLLAVPQGKIIAATEVGLFESDGTQTRPLLANGKPLLNVNSIIHTEDGQLWMSSSNQGLIVRNPEGSCFEFSVKHGLYDDEIFGIISDKSDRLWLACSRGIFFVSRSELLDCVAGKITRVNSSTFHPTESLRTVECQRNVHPVAYRMQDDRIWFATNHGFLSVDSNMGDRQVAPPNVILDEFQANGRTISRDQQTESTTLSPGLANVSFRYTSTSYVIPQRTAFRYRLDGFDQNWVDAGLRREAFYTNLPPSTYRFRVQARHPGTEWTEKMSPVYFVVPPHFYETWWFLLLAASVIGLTAWGGYRLRLIQLRSRFQAVMAERLRIARELHDTLLQGFSGITMQMQALSNRLGPSAEQQALKDVIADAGFCLREARRTVAGLRSRPGNTRLSVAISEAARQATEQQNIKLSLQVADVPQSLPMEVEYHLLRIAQEAISNTIKHAGARNLVVRMNVVGRRLRLAVIDDGRGFVVNGEEMRTPGHYGLIGMRERAIQIQGRLEIISDRGEGTTIQVEIPLPNGTGASSSSLEAEYLA